MGHYFTFNAVGLAGVFLLAACQPAPTPNDNIDTSFVDIGQSIVQSRCTVCHTAAPNGDSPRADAPPLRTVLATYNPDALADDFRERIHVGHPDMPDFEFNVKEVDGLLAYLTSIQEPKKEP